MATCENVGADEAGLEGCGAETVYIDVPRLQVHPCIGCMKCRSSLKCCLPKDGAQRVLQSMKEADAVIIGAPCYWGNMPGEVKVFSTVWFTV